MNFGAHQIYCLSGWYRECRLCPRECGIDRTARFAPRGRCGETHRLRVAYIGPHRGEEPPISGSMGSGTVFFTGCPLRCSFCQNRQISREGMGTTMTEETFWQALIAMITRDRVHNVNFVTPDHFFPHILRIARRLRENGYLIPLVYNLSGYQSLELLGVIERHADIYLPDFKYADPSLAERLSRCRDYPEVALSAIAEMIRQKGALDACTNGEETAGRGVLVRHLILPGYVQNSVDALTMLYVEFGRDLPISLMSQYHPVCRHEDPNLNRFLRCAEFERVYRHAGELGFRHLFVQFPEQKRSSEALSAFLPDFRCRDPFSRPRTPISSGPDECPGK